MICVSCRRLPRTIATVLRLSACLVMVMLPSACASKEARPQVTPAPASRSALETYFPMVDGKLYAYLAHGETGGQTLIVLKVERKSTARGTLRGASLERAFTFSETSVTRVGGGTVLALPLQEGAVFKGDHGGRTRIADMNVSIRTQGGVYTHCLRTEEEASGSSKVQTRTTFCPEVGVVRLEVVGSTGSETMELQSYGDPVVIR
jgi:hypothetical protein